MRHLHAFAEKARHHGVHAWRTARHYGRIADRYISGAAQLYGTAIQPGLRAAGVDTRELDANLMSMHQAYKKVSTSAKDGLKLGDEVASHFAQY